VGCWHDVPTPHIGIKYFSKTFAEKSEDPAFNFSAKFKTLNAFFDSIELKRTRPWNGLCCSIQYEFFFNAQVSKKIRVSILTVLSGLCIPVLLSSWSETFRVAESASNQPNKRVLASIKPRARPIKLRETRIFLIPER
jgi:hypothetical protein